MSYLLKEKGNLDIFNRFHFSGVLCGVESIFGCQKNRAIRCDRFIQNFIL